MARISAWFLSSRLLKSRTSSSNSSSERRTGTRASSWPVRMIPRAVRDNLADRLHRAVPEKGAGKKAQSDGNGAGDEKRLPDRVQHDLSAIGGASDLQDRAIWESCAARMKSRSVSCGTRSTPTGRRKPGAPDGNVADSNPILRPAHEHHVVEDVDQANQERLLNLGRFAVPPGPQPRGTARFINRGRVLSAGLRALRDLCR